MKRRAIRGASAGLATVTGMGLWLAVGVALAGPPTLPPLPPGPGAAVPEETGDAPGGSIEAPGAPEAPPEEAPLPDVEAPAEEAPIAEPEPPSAAPEGPTAAPEAPRVQRPTVQRPAAVEPAPETTPEPAPAPEPAPPAEPATAAPTAAAPATAPSKPKPKPATGAKSEAKWAPEPDVDPDAEPTWGTGIAKEAESPRDRFKHRGFVLDVNGGVLGCSGGMCGSGRHNTAPGGRVGGFIGGNLFGVVELGLLGGWGRMQTDVAQSNVLDLYGIDSGAAEPLAEELGIDLATLGVDDAQMQTANVAPVMRLHFPRKGRVGAYAGAGVGYSLLRTKYQGPTDNFRVDFHGIDVPIHGGLMVYVLPRLAVGAQFEYRWSRFLGVVIDHPERTAGAPLRTLQSAVRNQGFEFDPQLPNIDRKSVV